MPYCVPSSDKTAISVLLYPKALAPETNSQSASSSGVCISMRLEEHPFFVTEYAFAFVTEPLTASMHFVLPSPSSRAPSDATEPEKFGPANQILELGETFSMIVAAREKTLRSKPSVGSSGIRNTSRYLGRRLEGG